MLATGGASIPAQRPLVCYSVTRASKTGKSSLSLLVPALVEDARRDAPCREEAGGVGVGDRDPDRVLILLARRDIARNDK